MKEKPEDDIHNVTNERLAEMLEQHNEWRRGNAPYDKPGTPPPFGPHLLGEVIDEAARRLRNIPKPSFNYEQFE